MASPQCADGYTRIANELLDAMCHTHLSSAESSVIHAIMRKTYGYNKKADRISASQLAEMTGLCRDKVVRALSRLRRRNVITREGSQTGLQKDYTKWTSAKIGSAQIGTKTSAKNARKLVPKLAHTKERKTMKDNIPKEKKGDYLDATLEFAQQRQESWTIPASAGGADCLGDDLVDILCQHLGIAELPKKKRASWRKAITGIVSEWQATGDDARAALKNLLDPKGELGYKRYSSPFQQSFANDYGMYLGRMSGTSAPHVLEPGGVI